MNPRGQDQRPRVLFCELVAVLQNFRRKHFHAVLESVVHFDLYAVRVNVDFYAHMSVKPDFVVVELIGIVGQFIDELHGVFLSANDNLHVKTEPVRGVEKRPPID